MTGPVATAARLPRTRWYVAVGAPLAAAADLGIAAARGYLFRSDVVTLFCASLATAAALATLSLALIRFGRLRVLLERAPRATVLAVALWPVAFKHLYTARHLEALAPVVAAAAIISILAVLEVRRRSGPTSTRTAVIVVLISVVVLLGSVVPRQPGVSELQPASRGLEATAAKPNLIVIVLDTLRAGHLGLYGYERQTSPFLDELATSSMVFEHAISSSSWTLPAHASLFTGLFPRAHGADLGDPEDPADARATDGLAGFSTARPLASDAVTLAEIARHAGLETGAICANNSFLHRFFQLDQGFDTYIDVLPGSLAAEPAGLWLASRLYRPLRWLANGNARVYLMASEVNQLAIRWIRERRDRRFFLFLNYMDAHDPYLPLRGYRSLFPKAWPPPSVNQHPIRARQRPIRDEERRALVDAYDAEIRYLDDQLRELFAQLGEWGVLDRTLVVILGDHGESFGEHQDLGHGNGVYDAEVRIPLIFRLPGQTEGERIARTVHIVDLMPTLLGRMGLALPSRLHGTSLWTSEREHPPVAYSGRFSQLASRYPEYFDRTHWAIYHGRWKLITRSDGEMELLDLEQDPDELHDLAAERPELVAELSSMLARFEASIEPRFEVGIPPRDPALLERLRALGYVE